MTVFVADNSAGPALWQHSSCLSRDDALMLATAWLAIQRKKCQSINALPLSRIPNVAITNSAFNELNPGAIFLEG